MKTFTVDVFDTKGLQKLAKQFELSEGAYKRAIDSAIREIMHLAEIRMHSELAQMGLGDSKLASGIKFNRVKNGFSISSKSKYVMFVEFGTGIIGEMNPHPNLIFMDVDWVYDENEHGRNGWWYPTTENDPNPTKKFSTKSGEWIAFTRGLESRPFLYNTWLYVRRITTRIVKKHLSKVGLL